MKIKTFILVTFFCRFLFVDKRRSIEDHRLYCYVMMISRIYILYKKFRSFETELGMSKIEIIFIRPLLLLFIVLRFSILSFNSKIGKIATTTKENINK